MFSFPVTSRVEKLCSHYGIECERVRVGFKEITKLMTGNDVLLGGEESGGIAFHDHIPERDGIWAGLTLMQWIIETGKSIKDLISEVYSITGPFYFERQDIHLNKNIRNKVIEFCNNGIFKQFGRFMVNKTEELDGFKMYLGSDQQWVMIRLSGTEPILRLYAEAENKETVLDILASVENVINRL
ncbi:MAG: hypothetical protein HC906_00280 [Bacteroidales bacterium]|nr:hypothetical protein [Bacteroidales bacterium]